jgi:hypothetical protein
LTIGTDRLRLKPDNGVGSPVSAWYREQFFVEEKITQAGGVRHELPHRGLAGRGSQARLIAVEAVQHGQPTEFRQNRFDGRFEAEAPLFHELQSRCRCHGLGHRRVSEQRALARFAGSVMKLLTAAVDHDRCNAVHGAPRYSSVQQFHDGRTVKCHDRLRCSTA